MLKRYYIVSTKVGIILFMCFLLIGCDAKSYSGTEATGFSHFPKDNRVSPERAIEFAKPYLGESFELRQARRGAKYPSNLPLDVYIILKGDFYYVTKDYYHHKAMDFYLHNAVKVNKKTGEITKPSLVEK
ncbi:MAG: hypothetical protein WC522_07290 [Candidatus Omnitrophota bacterium]